MVSACKEMLTSTTGPVVRFGKTQKKAIVALLPASARGMNLNSTHRAANPSILGAIFFHIVAKLLG